MKISKFDCYDSHLEKLESPIISNIIDVLSDASEPLTVAEILKKMDTRLIKAANKNNSLNSTLVRGSDNTKDKKPSGNKQFRITSTNPNKFWLINRIDELEGLKHKEVEPTSIDNKELFLEFWELFLSDINNYTSIFKNRKKSADPWILGPSGLPGIWYACIGSGTYARLELIIKSTEAKALFDNLSKFKKEINSSFGDELIWERLDDKIMSRVKYQLDGVNIYDRSDWSEMLLFFKNNINRFEKAIQPYLNKLRSKDIEVDVETNDIEINPFMQAICVLGESGAGKSHTVDLVLQRDNEKRKHEYQFIIPSASTTNLLVQFSPLKRDYVPSKLGTMIVEASKPENSRVLYTAVFDECHKSNVISMINDELLQCISLERNDRKRFISLDDDTAKQFGDIKRDRNGRIFLPDNLGFIFISSKPSVIENNDDFFNRVDVVILKSFKEEKIESIQDLLNKVVGKEFSEGMPNHDLAKKQSKKREAVELLIDRLRK